MERPVSSPIEIKKSLARIHQFEFENILSFAKPLSIDGLKMRLQTLGSYHYRVDFTNMDYSNPMTQKLTYGKQYETSDGAFVFRGMPIKSGDREYLFLEFNLKTPD